MDDIAKTAERGAEGTGARRSDVAAEPQQRLEMKVLIIGYAMSRLDMAYLAERRLASWRAGYKEVAEALDVAPASLKNLRDEFDPFFDNPRRGWHHRDIRPTRKRVLEEMAEVSDAALLELVDRLLRRDDIGAGEALDVLVQPRRSVSNVADRLLTGRLAESFFLQNCQDIVGVSRHDIEDCRYSALGYDFAVIPKPEMAIEVKGLRSLSGGILFTDREWQVAQERALDYWLVVVGDVYGTARARVVRDPRTTLEASCVFQRTVSANWQAHVSIG